MVTGCLCAVCNHQPIHNPRGAAFLPYYLVSMCSVAPIDGETAWDSMKTGSLSASALLLSTMAVWRESPRDGQSTSNKAF